MRLVNVTKQVVTFPCGDEERLTGRHVRDAFNSIVPERRRFEKVHTVNPGETIELEDGYCKPKRSASGASLPSFLQEMGLADKLKPVEPKG